MLDVGHVVTCFEGTVIFVTVDEVSEDATVTAMDGAEIVTE